MRAHTRWITVLGWSSVVLVAALMLVVRGWEELAPALVFAAVGAGMAAWVWLRGSRPSAIASVALDALWLIQFVAYTVAGVVGDDVDVGILATDLVAVLGGAAIVTGAVAMLLDARRDSAAPPP